MSVSESGANGSRAWLGRAALAASAVFALGACAPRYVTMAPPIGPEKYKNGGGPNPGDPYRFVIAEDAHGCPDSVTMGSGFQNCPDQATDCVRVRGGQTVRFQSPSNDFFLQFDPFGKCKIDANGQVLDLTTEKSAKLGKPYTFKIGRSAPACSGKFVDPQIILD